MIFENYEVKKKKKTIRHELLNTQYIQITRHMIRLCAIIRLNIIEIAQEQYGFD